MEKRYNEEQMTEAIGYALLFGRQQVIDAQDGVESTIKEQIRASINVSEYKMAFEHALKRNHYTHKK